MDKDLVAYLDARFDTLSEEIKGAAALNASEHRSLHGRIKAEEDARKALGSRLWGIAAGVLIALAGALIAIVTGQKAP